MSKGAASMVREATARAWAVKAIRRRESKRAARKLQLAHKAKGDSYVTCFYVEKDTRKRGGERSSSNRSRSKSRRRKRRERREMRTRELRRTPVLTTPVGSPPTTAVGTPVRGYTPMRWTDTLIPQIPPPRMITPQIPTPVGSPPTPNLARSSPLSITVSPPQSRHSPSPLAVPPPVRRGHPLHPLKQALDVDSPFTRKSALNIVREQQRKRRSQRAAARAARL